VTKAVLTEARIELIEKEIRIRKARADPPGAVRPAVLFCLENLAYPGSSQP
jgi:hypothetical protein